MTVLIWLGVCLLLLVAWLAMQQTIREDERRRALDEFWRGDRW